MSARISHSSEKTITYSCKSRTAADRKKFVECGRFPSEISNDCEIAIWFAYPKPILGEETDQVVNKASVAVEKTHKTPTEVTMDVQIKESRGGVLATRMATIYDWEALCYFRDVSFTCSAEDTTFEIVVKITWSIPESPNSFLRISDFLMNEFLSDVTIVIGEEQLPAHKMVLCAASPVMLAMLTSPMKEAKENCIVIKDVEIDVMKAVLKLLYTGNDEQLDEVEMALKALAVSEQYDMKKLKQLCEQKILKKLKIDNAVTVLDVADTYQAGRLVKKSLEFIVDHRKEIIHTEACKELYLKKPLLMMQFTMSLIDDAK